MTLTQIPSHVYRYIEGHYGWIGLVVACISMFFMVMAIYTIWDRRRL